MDKTKFNFLIDVLMILAISALVGLGLLLEYVFIPCRTAWDRYGVQVDITWLGLAQHPWGVVQLSLAILLMTLLALRLILHWQMTSGLFARLFPDASTRKGISCALLLVAGLLVYLPYLVTPEVNEVSLGKERRLESSSGTQQSTLIPPTSILLENEGDLNLSGHFDALEPKSEEISISKSVGAKKSYDHWPKKSKYKTLYRRPKTIAVFCPPPRP
jgi:hypothetical protein